MEFKSPLEILSRCWIPATYLKSRILYAYGNSPMEDMFQDFSLPAKTDALFLGSGDIRHTLKTIAGLAVRPKSTSFPKSVNFHLVDIDTEVIARDVVLWEILSQMDPAKEDDVEFLWNIWYNFSLTELHYTRLQRILRCVTEEIYAPPCIWKFGNDATKISISKTLTSWSQQGTWDLKEVNENRKKNVQMHGNYDLENHPSVDKLCFLSTLSFYKDTHCSEFGEKEMKFISEIRDIVFTGNSENPNKTSLRRKFVNPTMMRPRFK